LFPANIKVCFELNGFKIKSNEKIFNVRAGKNFNLHIINVGKAFIIWKSKNRDTGKWQWERLFKELRIRN
jgi:hypothetical protein